MTQRIVVVTTNGPSREDGNVYYSRYLLVGSDTLSFDEPLFASEGCRVDGDGDDQRMDAVPEILRGLGYDVVEMEATIVATSADTPRSLDDIISGMTGRTRDA
jgi:hypothetical protein